MIRPSGSGALGLWGSEACSISCLRSSALAFPLQVLVRHLRTFRRRTEELPDCPPQRPFAEEVRLDEVLVLEGTHEPHTGSPPGGSRDAWRHSGEFGILCGMAATLVLDPSRPCQIGDDLLALWLPRGRGRDDLAPGLLAAVNVCGNPACPCTTATLQARLIDDRAERAAREGDKLHVTWRATSSGSPAPEGGAVLEVDMTTGVVVERGGGEPPGTVAGFFEEPLPFWVLDALWVRWRAPRLPSRIDWQAQGLDLWEPGALLSTMLVFPEARPDRYLVDDKVYQVDTLFCVVPDCICTEARLSVLAVSEDGKGLDEIGSARLPPETMVPVGFDGERKHHEAFVQIYLDWRQRNVPAKARLLELRDLTRQRGLDLHRLAATRSQPVAYSQVRTPTRHPSPAARPGRNAPCPCGSGQKYKRCCGK